MYTEERLAGTEYYTIYRNFHSGEKLKIGSVNNNVMDGEFYARDVDRNYIGHSEFKQEAIDMVTLNYEGKDINSVEDPSEEVDSCDENQDCQETETSVS